MSVKQLIDEELLRLEPLARIDAWDAKKNFDAPAKRWCELAAECERRGLTYSTSWADFWPTSPRAKQLRRENGRSEPKHNGEETNQ
jgi:hypothetical protein